MKVKVVKSTKLKAMKAPKKRKYTKRSPYWTRNLNPRDVTDLFVDDEPTEIEDPPLSPLEIQVGGDHYKDMPIQPIEFIVKNGLGYVEGSVIKYICRYKLKGGLEDLEKAKHHLEVLIYLEENRNG